MECILKILLIIVSITTAIIGVYLAFLREKQSLRNKTIEIQEGSGSVTEGTFNVRLAISVSLILIGLGGAYFSIMNLPPCRHSVIDIGTQTDSTTSNPVHLDTTPNNKNVDITEYAIFSGTVIDAKTQKPIKGVSININTKLLAITDGNGAFTFKYAILNSTPYSTIEFTCKAAGYKAAVINELTQGAENITVTMNSIK